MDPFIGQITFFTYGWAPLDWSLCWGQILNVNANQALYSLIGNTYGGSQNVNFALPDLRGRVIVGQGTTPSGNIYACGANGGTTSTILTNTQTPQHTHLATLNLVNATTTVKAYSGQATNNAPSTRNNVLAGATNNTAIYSGTAPDTLLNVGGNTVSGSVAITPTGTPTAVSLMQPYLTLTPCIALTGLYPQRQ